MWMVMDLKRNTQGVYRVLAVLHDHDNRPEDLAGTVEEHKHPEHVEDVPGRGNLQPQARPLLVLRLPELGRSPSLEYTSVGALPAPSAGHRRLL